MYTRLGADLGGARAVALTSSKEKLRPLSSAAPAMLCAAHMPISRACVHSRICAAAAKRGQVNSKPRCGQCSPGLLAGLRTRQHNHPTRLFKVQ